MKIKFLKTLNLLSLILLPINLGAETLLDFTDRLQKTYETTETLLLDFKQSTYVALLEKSIQKKGQAIFQKPSRFFIEYAEDNGRTYVSNGKRLWIYEKGDSQVQSYPLGDDDVPAEALSFLGGLGNLKRDFAVEEPQEEKVKQLKLNKSLRWLELTPLKKQSSIEWILLGIEPKILSTEELYIYNESQNLSHYTLENRKANVEVKPEIFDFKKEGVKEIKN